MEFKKRLPEGHPTTRLSVVKQLLACVYPCKSPVEILSNMPVSSLAELSPYDSESVNKSVPRKMCQCSSYDTIDDDTTHNEETLMADNTFVSPI